MKQKNILLIMTDQHRGDHVGYSGCGKVKTPNIDRIAAGTRFTCCQTVNPICTPARTALLTGRYSHQIGTLSMSGDLSRDIRTFPQVLQENGYHTMASGKLHYLQPWPWDTPRCRALDLTALSKEMRGYGFDQLWETAGKQLMLKNYCDYSAHLDSKGLLEAYLDAVEAAGDNQDTPDFIEDQGLASVLPEEDYVDVLTCDHTLAQLAARPKDAPFFALCSFCSPHKPFDPPQRYLDMVPYEEIDDFVPGPGDRQLTQAEKEQLYRKRRAYKAMILLLDDQVGRLLSYLDAEGLSEDTVVIFTSDHGEMLGDHFRIQKAIAYREACTVPLAIHHPNCPSGIVCNSPVELIDVTATILACAGLSIESMRRPWPAYNGCPPARSLMPIVSGETDAIRDFSFSECNGEWQMLQTATRKYVRQLRTPDALTRHEALYDLVLDPQELVNRAHDPRYAGDLSWFRLQREYLIDTTQPAQQVWAPLLIDTSEWRREDA